jgi:hypothetical protein
MLTLYAIYPNASDLLQAPTLEKIDHNSSAMLVFRSRVGAERYIAAKIGPHGSEQYRISEFTLADFDQLRTRVNSWLGNHELLIKLCD